jgi:hypothetical protein
MDIPCSWIRRFNNAKILMHIYLYTDFTNPNHSTNKNVFVISRFILNVAWKVKETTIASVILEKKDIRAVIINFKM